MMYLFQCRCGSDTCKCVTGPDEPLTNILSSYCCYVIQWKVPCVNLFAVNILLTV